jgi:hypothetical protein
MSEELAITLTWATFCAFCVVLIALVFDAVSERMLSETKEESEWMLSEMQEESAKRKARKIVRAANRDLLVWRVKRAVRGLFRKAKNIQRLKTIKFWNL